MNNTICDNKSSHEGGGLYGCDGIILNNTIAGNESGGMGGGLLACNGLIINCIVWGNTAYEGSQLPYSNTPISSCVENLGVSGRGNISADPLFVDSAAGNYHLQPNSPCVNAGNTFYLSPSRLAVRSGVGGHLLDIDGECRVSDGAVDMGSDEVGSYPDADSDLLADKDEATRGSNPNDPDSDRDGLNDGIEVMRGTSPIAHDTPTSISIPAQHASIQEGIFFALPQELVVVSPGLYRENLCFMGKNVVLQSANPLDDVTVKSTVIDGDGLFSAMFFDGSEKESSAVRGFTIRGGRAQFGGGVCANGARTLIERNRIEDNQVQFQGGGIYRCGGTIRHNVISGNSSQDGGGLYDCDGIIQYNTISDNTGASAVGRGGGLFMCDGAIRNNVIAGNSAKDGGGVGYCNGIIQNNTISSNRAEEYGGGMYWCEGTIAGNTIVGNSAQYDGGGLSDCQGFIMNCIIWGNTVTYGGEHLYNCAVPWYSCVEDWTSGGKGNIGGEPRFVNAAAGDYHLLPGSPCVDAGYTYYLWGEHIADIDGECRVAGQSVDMGSDEVNSSADSDGDLLSDSNEAGYGSDPHDADTDEDGLMDGAEAMRGTNPVIYDSPVGISIPDDYATVQEAISLAFPAEVIAVSPGIYSENLRLTGRNIVLQSLNPYDDGVTSSTILDGNGLFSVVWFTGSEDERSAIRGLTIRNGTARYGAGICGNGTQAAIERNKITGNFYTTFTYGGGIYDCDGSIRYNTIIGNTADAGGGLYECDGMIENNTIAGNHAGYGGGICECEAMIQGNVISGNKGYWGPGGGVANSPGRIAYNIISENWSELGGGGLAKCDGAVEYNLIVGNSSTFGGGLHWCEGITQYNLVMNNVASVAGGGFHDCGGIINGNIVSWNVADGAGCEGGGLYGCHGIMQNNVISYNSAHSDSQPGGNGGGMSACYGTVRNNTIYGNAASNHGGGLSRCDGAIMNSIVWGNGAVSGSQLDDACSTPSFCCIEDPAFGGASWTGRGTGNIVNDPQLADPGSGGFHLLPTSPCIDAGELIADVGWDFEGDSRPYNGASQPRGDGSDYDIGADEFTPTQGTAYDFEEDAQGWTFSGEIFPFIAPRFSCAGGMLWLETTNNISCFGFWSSPSGALFVSPGQLYQARFQLHCPDQPSGLVPTIRLRAISSDFQQVDWLEITSAGQGESSPGASGRWYDLLFEPAGTAASLSLAFDVLNFDPSDAAQAMVGLDAVNVYAYDASGVGVASAQRHYAFDTGAESWNFSGAVIPFEQLNTGVYYGALHLAARNNTNSFGYWYSPAGEITLGATPTLYRATFLVHSDQTDLSVVPEARLRIYTSNFHVIAGKECPSSGSGENSPTQTGRSYAVYFWSSNSALTTDLQCAFDLLNFSPDDAPTGTLSLDDVTIETVTLP